MTPQSRSDRTALASCAAWAIELVETPTTRIPEARAKLIAPATRAIIAALQPTEREHLTVEIRKLVAWCRAMNIKLQSVETLTEAYELALSHLPRDLLTKAFQEIKKTHIWGARPPLPREIAQTVSDEYCRRVKIKSGLFLASRAEVEKPVPMTPEERAERIKAVDDLLGQWRKTRAV